MQVLQNSGYFYDSTLALNTPEMGSRSWPFTMDNGSPDKFCRTCPSSESFPGLWEFPYSALKYDGQTYTMDPGMDKQASKMNKGRLLLGIAADARPVDKVLQFVFDESYKGNRAPLPIAVHAAWFESTERIKEAQKFIKYALSKPDVYFVTYTQVLEWMEAPVRKSEVAAWLKKRCRNRKLS